MGKGNVANLRPPWPKGVSGNPGALSKEVREKHMRVRELAATYSEDAINALHAMLNCGVPSVIVQAANSILDRAGLKPVAILDDTPGEEGIVLKWPLPKTTLDQ